MFTDFFDDLLARFGIAVEKPASPPGVAQVRDYSAITSIFRADAARQQSESAFFNEGMRPRIVIENNAVALGAEPQRRRLRF